MKQMLVTGGAGFIGSNFIRYILDLSTDVYIVNLDALTYAGNKENLPDVFNRERHEFVHGNICNQDLLNTLFSKHEFDYVVHFAAETHVDRSISSPTTFIETNIYGTYNLLSTANSSWGSLGKEKVTQRRFHHISTDEVYGTLSADDPAFTETTPYQPSSPYSASKAASDHFVRSFYHTYGLPATITNCSNNYGPYQYPEKFIPLVINRAIEGQSIPVYGDGKQVRDWLYVSDHCEAIWMVLTQGRIGETYNVGGENQPTNLEIVEIICNYLDGLFPQSPNYPHRQLIRHVADRPGHDRRYAMNIRKIGEELKWKPATEYKLGLEKTVNWYCNNQNWYEKIKAKVDYGTWMEKNYHEREGK